MTGVTVRYYPSISRTPALQLAMKGQLELVEAGLADPVPMVSWDHKAVVAFEGQRPIGAITFAHSEWANQVDVMIGYVLPDHRGRGSYRLMWEALIEKATEVGAKTIIGATSTDNAAMRAVAAKLGRTEFAVMYRFDLPDAAKTADA